MADLIYMAKSKWRELLDTIRTKGGTSASMTADQAIAAVEAIPSGGGGSNEWAADIARMTISFARGTLPEGNLVLDFPKATIGISTMLMVAAGSGSGTEIVINAHRVVGSTTASSITEAISNLEQSATKITKLTLNTDINPVLGSQFLYIGSIQRVLGTPLIATDLGGTGLYKKFNSTSLREFYLVPNKISGGGGVDTGVLEDATVISLANALKGGLATAQTLTIFNATTKAKCSTIVGTVSQVTEGGETYDFFTQDDSGTVTLADFITTVKGWTLA